MTTRSKNSWLERFRHSVDVSSWHWLVVILGVVAAVYAPTLGYDLVFDDHLQIERNRHIRSWSFIGKAFTDHVWSGQDGYSVTNSYRPLYLVWMTLNYSLFGTDPRGWHATTVLLYLGAIAGVWWTAGKVLGPGVGRIAATAVFAFHPTHVESVAWIAAFADAQVMIFFTLAFCLFVESTHPVSGKNLASVLCLIGALLTKEFAVFWMPMVFLYRVVLPDGRGWWTRGVAALRALSLHILATVVYLVVHKIVIPTPMTGNPLIAGKTILATAPSILLTYLKLLVWPVDLRLEYELGYVTSLTDPRFWGGALALVGMAGIVLYVGKGRPLLWVLAAWTVLPLAPTLNLIHFRPNEFLHDRYLFLPTLGFALLLGWGLATLAERRFALSIGVLGFVVAGLIGLSAAQNPIWKDDEALYGRILRYHPNNVFAVANLSEVMRDRQRHNEEIALLRRAIALDPDEDKYHNALGAALFGQARYAEAADALLVAARRNATYVERAEFCFNLGYALLVSGRKSEARPYLERAVRLAPENAQYWYTLGDVRGDLGFSTEAVAAYRRAADLDPSKRALIEARIAAVRRTP